MKSCTDFVTVSSTKPVWTNPIFVCRIIRIKNFIRKVWKKSLKNKLSMALFYQVQFKAGYQPFVISTCTHMYTAVDSGGLKTNCDHQQFLRSGTTWQCLTGSG